MSEGVTIAVIAAAPATLAAVLAYATALRTKSAVGTPNGSGNVTQMLERLLAGQTGQDVRLAVLERRTNTIDQRLDGIETVLGEITTN